MKNVALAFTILALPIAAFALRTLIRSGYFIDLAAPHFAGSCTLVPGAVGPEDITIHPGTGVAYISASDRHALRAGNPVPGAIFAYALNDPVPTLVNLTANAGIDFQPHGISLWTGAGGDRLFVINHPPPRAERPPHTVEIFNLDGDSLHRERTISDTALLTMPNDLLAVGPDSFYLTNTHAHPPGFRQQLETYLQIPGANILLFSQGSFAVAVGDLIFPNGINMSRDGRSVYVAMLTQRSLLVLDRDPATQRLSQRRSVFLDSGVDNIEVDSDGNLWIGSHPKLLDVVAQQKNPAEKAPAQVLRVDPNRDFARAEIYLDLGQQISAVSVAARYRDRLLIGQIFDDGFLDCRMR